MKLVLLSKGLETEKGQMLIMHNHIHFDLTHHILLVLDPVFSRANQNIITFLKQQIGYTDEQIILYESLKEDSIDTISTIYVTAGNPFDIWKVILDGRFDLFQNLLKQPNLTYIGASAGAILAGSDMRHALSRDKNYTNITDYTALGLIPYKVLPHADKQSSATEQYLPVGEDDVIVMNVDKVQEDDYGRL